jgi:DNA-binding LacI/PurR family transcriptional regulator
MAGLDVRPTLKDVAAAAGVSVTTVSDVVNGKGRVDPATRERVAALVAELGYRPHRSARALRSGRTGILALCLPVMEREVSDWLMSTDYDMALVAACAAAAVDSGHQLLLAPRPADPGELSLLEVDGVLIADPSHADPTVQLVRRAGVPLVTIDRDPTQDDGWWVSVDTAGGIEALCEHLVARGARSLGLVTADEPWAWYDDTRAAFLDWCRRQGAAGMVVDVGIEQSRAETRQKVGALAAGGDLPDALVTVARDAALGVLDACGDTGVDVPGRLRLAAAMDDRSLAVATPDVTALDLRATETARAAVELLIERVRRPDGPGTPRLLAPALRPRRSS